MRNFYFSFAGIVVLCLFGGMVQAQVQQRVESWNQENGKAEFIAIESVLEAPSYADGIQVLNQVLSLKAEEDFAFQKEESDALGMNHVKYSQKYRGFNVEYGTYTLHHKEGKVVSISGNYIDAPSAKLIQSISEEQALEKALEFVGAQKYMWEEMGNEQWKKTLDNNSSATWYPKAELVICKDFMATTKEQELRPVLAYKFDVYASQPVSRAYIYVDAETGKIIHVNSIIKTAVATGTAATRYSGTQTITTDSYNGSYRLRDNSRGNGIIVYNMKKGTNYSSAVDFTDADNNWTAAEYHNTNKDDVAMECHWALEKTYDYWMNKHNRNSFDGNGTLQKAYVHFDNAYDNAYWNGSVFTFGDGSGTYFDALASVDVTAHEHGHAVCSYTANLAYQNESGALNEAFSDIWGACVEYYAAPGKQTWIMGEDIERRSGHVGLRSMSDPKTEGLPDTYQGTNWAPLSSSPSQYNDYGGVHTNGGPLCYWFYLLSVGGSGTNDQNENFNITAIGIDKAEKIAYRMESVYLSANSNYANARTYAIQAATDLYGAGSNEVIQVTNAMYAIGVGDAYNGGGNPSSYCTSQGNNASYEWIAGVTIGSFSKTSGSAKYSDYTSTIVSLAAGSANNITLQPGFQSSAYSEYWKIWIDFNGDKDFEDAGELVFDQGGMSSSAVTGTINIPSTATGQTRMRVSMKYNGAQTACESFSYGEVEDYTVSFTTGGGDTQAPSAPTNLSSSNITATSATLSWTASTDNVGVTGYLIYSNGNNIGTVTATSANITGLTAATTYSFYVKAKDAAGNESAASSSISVTTLSNQVSYCASKGNNATYEWIDYVALNGMVKSSASNGGYADFTSSVANLPYGNNTITVSCGFKSSSYTEYWHVFIDFNHNGTFESTERVVYQTSTSSANLSYTFNVPTTALQGATRMRVTMKYNGAATACEAFSYGEVEDYTVNIGGTNFGFASSNAVTPDDNSQAVDFAVYPVPVVDELTVEFNEEREAVYTVYNLQGQAIQTICLQGSVNTVDVSALNAGTYMLVVNMDGKLVSQRFVKK